MCNDHPMRFTPHGVVAHYLGAPVRGVVGVSRLRGRQSWFTDSR